MEKVRILAIAPYEGLKEVLAAAAEARDDVDVDIYIGDLTEGAAIAKSLEGTEYDVVLSRGGTATLIGQSVSLPVVDIAPSVYDVLRFVRLAENTRGRFAVVGFANITGIADKVFDLVQRKVEIHTIRDAREAEEVVSFLQAQGYTLIVGDAVAVANAKRLRMNSILIASGEESVEAALNEAVRFSGLLRASIRHNLIYRDILEKSEMSIIAFDEDKKQLFSNLSPDQIEYQRVFHALPEYVSSTLREGEFHITRRSKGYLWSITGRRMKVALGPIAVFYIKRSLSIPQFKPGVVEYRHMLDSPLEGESLPIDNVGAMASVMALADRIGKTQQPVLIAGGIGSAIESVAGVLYQANPLKVNPMIVIDCALIDEKSFLWLLDHEDSPLCETRMTIFLMRFSSLDEALQFRYIQFAHCTTLHKRNRMLYGVNEMPDNNGPVGAFFNGPDFVQLRLPTLSERPEDISNLANLYLSAFNIEMGRQVMGFSEKARDQLGAYQWPGNNDQLCRVVRQCLIRSQSDVISEDEVRQVIDEEIRLSRTAGLPCADMTGTLEEINARIAAMVMREEGMNRSRTAERLGISRSTLWRMLKL